MIQWKNVFNNVKATNATENFAYYDTPFKELVRTYRQLGLKKEAAAVYGSNSKRVRQLARKAMSRRYL